jgi:hypothetical protein
MGRRTIGLAMAGLMLWWAAGAQAQTSTSSTSSSSSSTSTTSTTSTTVANPCTGQVCTAEPPAAFLSGTNGEVRLDRGGYCWRSPTPDAQGVFTALCVDTVPRLPDAVLVVQAGEELTLRFGAMAPTEVSLERDDQSTPLSPGNPVRFRADLPAGVQVVRFFTRWLQGDASYGVRLDVRAAAPPAAPRTGGAIALTG